MKKKMLKMVNTMQQRIARRLVFHLFFVVNRKNTTWELNLP